MSLGDGQVTVKIFLPDSPFGGAKVTFPDGFTRIIQFVVGSPVRTVFGRIGDVSAECSDYAGCYAIAGSGLPPGGDPGFVLTKQGAADYDTQWSPSVIGQATGWTTPTGTGQKSGYDTDSGTLLDVKQTLKSLIEDLTSLGLLGP